MLLQEEDNDGGDGGSDEVDKEDKVSTYFQLMNVEDYACVR